MLNLGATAQGVQKIYIVGNHNNLRFRNEMKNFEHKNKKKVCNIRQIAQAWTSLRSEKTL